MSGLAFCLSPLLLVAYSLMIDSLVKSATPMYASALLLVAGGLWLLWRALLGDRARGRRRCPKCWYDLRGTPGMTCSECGFAARRERQFYRDRRRWGRVFAACLLFLAAAGFSAVPTIRQNGPLSVVPTSILLKFAPRFPEDQPYDPTTGARNPSRICAELLRRRALNEFDDEGWKYVFAHKGVLCYRRRWPAGTPLVVASRMPFWMNKAKVNIDPLYQGMVCLADDERSVIYRAPPSPDLGTWARFGPLPSRTEGVELSCEASWRIVSVRRPGDPPAEKDRWSGSVVLPVTAVETLEDVFAFDASPELTEAVKSALLLKVYILIGRDGTRESRSMMLVLNREHDPRLAHVALGLKLQFRQQGAPVFTARFSPGCDPSFEPRETSAVLVDAGPESTARAWLPSVDGVGRCPDFGPCREALDRIAEGPEGWTVRVMGDAELALRDFERDVFWAGEFTVPLADISEYSTRTRSAFLDMYNISDAFGEPAVDKRASAPNARSARPGPVITDEP